MDSSLSELCFYLRSAHKCTLLKAPHSIDREGVRDGRAMCNFDRVLKSMQEDVKSAMRNCSNALASAGQGGVCKKVPPRRRRRRRSPPLAVAPKPQLSRDR